MTIVACIGCAEQYDDEREGNAVHCGRCADWLKENAASFSSPNLQGKLTGCPGKQRPRRSGAYSTR